MTEILKTVLYIIGLIIGIPMAFCFLLALFLATAIVVKAIFDL